MKKVKLYIFITLFILLSLTSVFGAGVSSEENLYGLDGEYDIRNVNWGMSEEEVFKSESYSFSVYTQEIIEDYYGENGKAYLANIIVENTETILGYAFAFNKLVRGVYRFSGDKNSYAADLRNFQNYIELFTNEYGTPEYIKNAYPPEIFEKMKSTLLAGDPDNKYPYYNFTLLWDTGDESIALNANKKGLQYILEMLFTSKKYEHLFIEAAQLEDERKEAEASKK